MSFPDQFLPDIYGAFQRGAEDGRANSLRSLAGQYFQQGQANPQMLAQIARAGGDALAFQHNDRNNHDDQVKQLAQFGRTFLALPPEQQAAAYPRFAQMAQSVLKIPEPPPYDPAHLENISKLVDALDGGGQSASGVQSTYVDRNGIRWAVMRDGSRQELGPSQANFSPIAGQGGIFGFDRNNNTAAPTMVGGPQSAPAPQQGPTFAGDKPPGKMDRGTAMSYVQNMEQAIGPQFQFPVPVRMNMIDSLMSTGTMDTGNAAPAPQGVPTQLQPAPKPSGPAGAPKPPAGYRFAPDGKSLEAIPGGPAQIALDARKAAQEANEKAGGVRQAEAAGQAMQLVAAIDRLTGSPGFKLLGTFKGDMEQVVPYLRNDAKDANAQLKNIAGQIALTTMSRLKALSATGATGFGSLTERELALLENSLATLQQDKISNKELADSLKIIRDTMQKVADWKEPAKSAPANGGWSIQAVP